MSADEVIEYRLTVLMGEAATRYTANVDEVVCVMQNIPVRLLCCELFEGRLAVLCRTTYRRWIVVMAAKVVVCGNVGGNDTTTTRNRTAVFVRHEGEVLLVIVSVSVSCSSRYVLE